MTREANSKSRQPKLPNDSELKGEQKKLLYFSSAAHAYTHIVILAIVPLLPMIQDAGSGFDLAWRDSFLLAAFTLFLFGLGAVPMGYVSDRVGPLKVILAGLIVIIISITIIVTAENVYVFSIALLLLGFGSSFYHPAGLSLVSQVYTEQRGLPMGIHGFLGNLGELSTPLLSGLIGAQFGWRWAYSMWLIVGIVILIVNLVLVSRGIQDRFIDNNKAADNRKKTFLLFRKSIGRVIVLALLFALLFELAYRGTIQFIPFAAQSFHGLTAAEATRIGGIIVTILMLGGAAAQLLGGKLFDRYGSRLPLMVFTTCSIIAILLMNSRLFEITITFNGSDIIFDTLLLGAILFGFGLFGTQPIINTIFAESTPTKIRGLFYGITFFVKVGLASMALIALAFIAEDSTATGFLLLLAFAVAAFIVLLFLKDIKSK
jgi:MFS family permease